MDIKIYNTLSREKETFKPIKRGVVSMYNCGPTVYDRIHIGNFRASVFPDILRRMFEYNGFKVKQIMNITDIGHLVGDGDEGEDKMMKALKRDGLPVTVPSMLAIGKKYAEQFRDDLKSLNVEPAEEYPHASAHVPEDIDIIKILDDKGFTYKTSDGLYFDTSKFPSYGKLGNISQENLREGARVAVNPEKRNPADFALWKFNEIGWESPWGTGFPGWHIECSAMSAKYLGQPFDIHTGAIDLIPTHHNNEIAQSESAHGKTLANYWMHNEFLITSGEKMSKSKGNFITLETLSRESISPLAYRYWLLTAHYRSPVNFTYDAVRGAQMALIRLMSALSAFPDGGKIIKDYEDRFISYINDDLNTPQAIALVWEIMKDTGISEADKKATILRFDKVLGLMLDTIPAETHEEIPAEIIALSEAREDARKVKDWDKADALRKEIESRGYDVSDTEKGLKISRK